MRTQARGIKDVLKLTILAQCVFEGYCINDECSFTIKVKLRQMC